MLIDFLKKYEEIIKYLFFGVLTTVVSWGSFYVFYNVLKINYALSDVISWVLAVVFSFFANKFFVFSKDESSTKKGLFEFVTFVSSRLASGGLELFLIYIGVSILEINANIVKVVVSLLVVVINYISTKFIIFR